MRAWLTRYRPRYVRSLVYMLQSSEYNAGEYLSWYRRTRDFAHVEKRKALDKTAKARALMAVLWVEVAIAALILAFMLVAALQHGWPGQWLVVALIVWLALPYLLAYTVIIPLWLGKELIQKPKERQIVAVAKTRLVAHPAIKIAVAGSYGKTSMREILAATIGMGKRVAAAPHSYNTPLGISSFVRGLKGDEEVLIFELGEYYPGDVAQLCDLVQPDIGVITGINEAHLAKFKTLDRTVGTIWELADFLRDKPCYKNGESKLVADRAGKDSRLYSRRGVGEWTVTEAITGLDGTSFMAKNQHGAVVKAKSRLLGLHQVGPLVAALAIAHELGLSTAQIEAGLAETKPFDHRLQPRTDASGVVTIDDSYNGNPDGARVAIEFLSGLRGHRRIYVTPGFVEMGARSDEVHRGLGRQLAEAGIEKVILVRNSVTPLIAEGLGAAGFKHDLAWYDDALEMFAALPSQTVVGDVVLIQNDWPDNYA